MLPSGPAVIPVIVPWGVISPILPAEAYSVNQTFPSGPAVMPKGEVLWASGYSLRTPFVVMRPIMFESNSVNQSAPSSPTVISVAQASLCGMENSVNWPSVVTRPILLGACSGEPQGPVGARGDPPGSAFGRWRTELRDRAAGSDPSDHAFGRSP